MMMNETQQTFWHGRARLTWRPWIWLQFGQRLHPHRRLRQDEHHYTSRLCRYIFRNCRTMSCYIQNEIPHFLADKYLLPKYIAG